MPFLSFFLPFGAFFVCFQVYLHNTQTAKQNLKLFLIVIVVVLLVVVLVNCKSDIRIYRPEKVEQT